MRFLCPAVDPCVCAFVRDASISSGLGLAAWLDLDTVGASGFDLGLVGWFIRHPWSTFVAAILIWTLLDDSRCSRQPCLDVSHSCALNLVW